MCFCFCWDWVSVCSTPATTTDGGGWLTDYNLFTDSAMGSGASVTDLAIEVESTTSTTNDAVALLLWFSAHAAFHHYNDG